MSYARRGVFIFVFLLMALFPLTLLEAGNIRAIVCWCLIPAVVLLNKGFKGLVGKHDVYLLIFLAVLAAGLVNPVDKKAAQDTYVSLALIFVSLFYLGKLMFSREPRFCSAVICVSACVISLAAFAELAFRRNVLYEFLANPYYYRYLGVRPMSTQLNPAAFGSFLLGCVPFCGFFALRKGNSRWLGLSALAACLPSLLWTFSRGVFFGLICATVYYCWMTGRKKLLAVFLLCLCGLIALASFSRDLNLNRFGFTRFISGSGDSIISPYRSSRLEMAAAMVSDHPFTGVGLNNFRVRFDDYSMSVSGYPYEFKVADNMYLTLAAEAGLPCLAAFLLFIFMLFRGRSVAGGAGAAALAAMTGLVGLLANMAAYELFYWNNVFMLFCLLCGFIAAANGKEGPAILADELV